MWGWTQCSRNRSENRNHSRYFNTKKFNRGIGYTGVGSTSEAKATRYNYSKISTVGNHGCPGLEEQEHSQRPGLCCKFVVVCFSLAVCAGALEPAAASSAAQRPSCNAAPPHHHTPAMPRLTMLVPLLHCCKPSRTQTPLISIPPNPQTEPFLSRT